MASKKPTAPAPKKKEHFAGSILDGISWLVREAALPVPDSLTGSGEKKKEKKGKK